MTENGKRWLRIPILLLVDLILFVVSLVVEMTLRTNKEDGAVFTVILAFILAVVTGIVLIVTILKSIQSFFEKDGSPRVKKHPKAKYYVIMALQIIVSTVLVMVVGKHEIDAFYARPDHVGFAIPFVSFLLAAFLFVMTLIVVGVCLILIFRKPRNKD